MSVLIHPRDLQCILFELLDVENVCQSDRYAHCGKAMFEAPLETAHRIALEQCEPLAKICDEAEPRLEDGRTLLPDGVADAMKAYISETQAGSSMGDLKTEAIPTEADHYLSTGAKMWITEAAQDCTKNIVPLVFDFPLERLYRDNRLNTIPEGTYGIQAHDPPSPGCRHGSERRRSRRYGFL